MNTYVVPDFVWNLFDRIFAPNKHKPSVVTLASVITIEPSEAQLKRKEFAEKALMDVQGHIMALSSACRFLDIAADNELRSLVGKAMKARRRIAHDIYVKTQIEE